jgi:archaellum component FlaC
MPSAAEIADVLEPALEEMAGQAFDGVKSIEDVLPEIGEIATRTSILLAALSSPSLLAETIAALDAATVAISVTFFCVVLLAAFALILMVWLVWKWFHNGIYHIPIIGHAMYRTLENLGNLLYNVQRATGRLLGAEMAKLLHAIATLVQWGNAQNLKGAGRAIDKEILRFVEPVHHEVDHLWSWVSQINNWVNEIAHDIGGLSAGPAQNSIPTKDQIAAIQKALAVTNARVEQNQDDVAMLVHRVEQVEDDLGALANHLTGVRAINVNLPDIQNEVAKMLAELKAFEMGIQPRVAANTSTLGELAPLAVLALAGPRGIGNLRRLQDNPCQCPQLPNVGGILAEALAAYEFVTNG